MLEHDALAGLHAVDAAVKDAGHQHIGRIDAGIIHAGVAVLAEPDFHIRCAGAADEDAEVGGEHEVGVAGGGKAGLDCAVIHGHHQAGNRRRGDAGVGGELDGG